MRRSYDAIVVGVGGMGSAAVHALAKRGKKVLGLERFDVPHDHGSSHGVNRIIRLAYYEHPSYVPLLRRSYELWHELEQEAGEPLLVTTGSIDTDTEDGEVFAGSLASCQIHDLPHEVLSAREVAARFPGYRLPAGHFALFQPAGGFLLAERSVVAHVEAAQARGAVVKARERVLGWERSAEGGFVVESDRGRYESEALVVAAGAWNSELIPALAGEAVPERQALAWFQPSDPALFGPARFPVFNARFDEGRYYGFPVFGIPGFKIGRYHHLGEEGAAEELSRTVTREDEAVLRLAVERYFPQANGEVMTLKTCLFTNSPDEHFLLGPVSGEPQLFVAAGFSGHGYKFCSVVGEILADLVTEGGTRHDISLLAPDRFRT